MKRDQFTKQNIGSFRDALQKALDKIGVDLGVRLHAGDVKYREQNCTVQLKVDNIVDGKAADEAANDFKRCASQYGFNPSDLGREFSDDNGDRCRISGLLVSRRKYSIRYHNITRNKLMLATPAQIQWMLKLPFGLRSNFIS